MSSGRDSQLSQAEPGSLGPSGFDPARIGAMLRSLMNGEFSSLNLSFNDLHASNYMTAQQWADDGHEWGDYNDPVDWVSREEQDKALASNSVWSLQWYPDTPVGFCIIRASSFEALIEWVAAQGIEAGTDETLQAAQPEGQEPGPVGMRPDAI